LNNQSQPPIIIIRKKSGHPGHHGGAWKVAYADFVTAMMALFIVLWLMNADERIREAISAYFRDPSGTGQHSGSAAAGTGESLSIGRDNMDQLKEELEVAIKKSPELQKLKDYVQMSVTGEGLRVEMMESETGVFFESGSGRPSETGHELIIRLAEELKKLPNDLMIEGHTDAKPFAKDGDYSNWELSTDRANSARRLMEADGLAHGRIVQVRGFADQSLHDRAHPEAASNRRISVIVRYQDAREGEKAAEKPADHH
jgi:chemotaxis protein MotB